MPGVPHTPAPPLPAHALALDAPREAVLARAAELIGEAWRGFDQARAYQPPVDDALRELLRAGLPDSPTPVMRALDEAALVLDESLAQARPRFFGFVGSSGLEIGVIADALAACHDVNLAAWAAAASEVEQQAMLWLGEFVGYPVGGGACTSGGQVSNLTALAAARERALPGARREGMDGRRGAVYVSAEAHDSVLRACELLGIGERGMRVLPIDGLRRMRPADLAFAIDADRKRGIEPVAAIATAGTTLTGAVDPIGALADVCAARRVWLHVDGAYGLPAAAAPSTAALFEGLDRADSVAVDAHKWLFLPKACSAVLVRDESALRAAFGHEAAYMPRDEDETNAVETTLEYSRPFRALKLWLAFRVHGAAALRAAIEHDLALARLLADEVRAHDDLELVCEPQLSIVPFRHAPRGDRDLDAHNAALARALQADGRVYVASATIDGTCALRPCFVNYRTTPDDVRALVSIACELGDRLAAG